MARTPVKVEHVCSTEDNSTGSCLFQVFKWQAHNIYVQRYMCSKSPHQPKRAYYIDVLNGFASGNFCCHVSSQITFILVRKMYCRVTAVEEIQQITKGGFLDIYPSSCTFPAVRHWLIHLLPLNTNYKIFCHRHTSSSLLLSDILHSLIVIVVWMKVLKWRKGESKLIWWMFVLDSSTVYQNS